MDNNYKIIIYGKKVYREYELEHDSDASIKVGTSKGCNIKIRDAGYHNRCQPNGIRSKIDIRNQVLVRQHRQYDTTDSKEFRQRNHFIILHTLSKFGKRMFQFGQKKHRHNHHDVKPGRLSGYDRSHAIGYQRNNNGSNTKNMKLRLLDVIVQPQQQSQHCTTSHKQTHIRRV